MSDELQDEGRPGVFLRIGNHTGEAIVGQVGGEERHQRLAVGMVSNVAARAQGLAEPNTVVIWEH